jgi:hypothetical protein
MTGPHHSFFVVRSAELAPADYLRLVGVPGDVEVPDDVLCYLGDTLAWIPAHNPALDAPCVGLCMHGPTVIRAEGARVAAAIFAAWERLLALGPDRLDLTGPYGAPHGDSRRGAYQRLHLERGVVCALLGGLARRAEEVATGGGHLYLLHLGI